jgi:hypothetical protein
VSKKLKFEKKRVGFRRFLLEKLRMKIFFIVEFMFLGNVE